MIRPYLTSIIAISDEREIIDLNVLDILGEHTWLGDLTVKIDSPSGSSATLWQSDCNSDDDFHISFDDESDNATLPCPRTDGLTYKPDNSLSIFDNESTVGDWILTIFDEALQDGGQLNSWSLEICYSATCPEDLPLYNLRQSELSVFEASENIYSIDNISGTSIIEYNAGNQIVLLPGFRLETGAELSIYIEGCDTTETDPAEFFFTACSDFMDFDLTQFNTNFGGVMGTPTNNIDWFDGQPSMGGTNISITANSVDLTAMPDLWVQLTDIATGYPTEVDLFYELNTPPQLTCPADIVMIGSDANNCGAFVMIPPPSATDDSITPLPDEPPL